ncbi:hypothetical protein ACRCUN_24460 [Mycobacterium sp. LTG2003]
MTICEEHGIEHPERFPCAEYERYRKLTAQSHTIVTHETRPIEDPNVEGLLGMERVVTGAYEAGFVGTAHDDDTDEDLY